jgi:hypothetical protein
MGAHDGDSDAIVVIMACLVADDELIDHTTHEIAADPQRAKEAITALGHFAQEFLVAAHQMRRDPEVRPNMTSTELRQEVQQYFAHFAAELAAIETDRDDDR